MYKNEGEEDNEFEDSWLTTPFKSRKVFSLSAEANKYFVEATFDGKK